MEWGEFRIGDLFAVTCSKSRNEGDLNLFPNYQSGLFEYVGRTKKNNGVKGYVKELDFKPNPPRVISVSQIGTIVAQIRPNAWYSSQNIFILSPLSTNLNRLISFFCVSAINKSLNRLFDQGRSNYPTLDSLRDMTIKLPIKKDGEIDYDIMDLFMSLLKKPLLSVTNKYLNSDFFYDSTLTDTEQQAISNLVEGNLKWKEYRVGDLFDEQKTQKLPYEAKFLPKEKNRTHSLPGLTSSFMNQGLNYYVPREGATILKNVISIPSNGDVYRAYFQSREFTVLSDAYVIKWTKNDMQLSREQYLFAVCSINKVTNLSISRIKIS